MALQVELSRVRVKEDKSAIVDEWMAFLKENMADTLLTLEAEKMYVETIFRESIDGREYLYWYSVQGEGGTDVEESESYIDKQHLAYWAECIDETYPMVDLSTQVVMIAPQVMARIEQLQSQE